MGVAGARSRLLFSHASHRSLLCEQPSHKFSELTNVRTAGDFQSLYLHLYIRADELGRHL